MNSTCSSLFTKEEVAHLEQLTIYDVSMSVTRMEMDDIQDNPFLAPSGKFWKLPPSPVE